MAAIQDKLIDLSAGARFDICATCGPGSQVTAEDLLAPSITRIFRPNGAPMAVLKVLLTNACHYDCLYCANRANRRFPRRSFRPEELASAFIDLRERDLVTGLFLSSGIHGSAADTMADMITAVEILREKHRFTGYIHLKVLPGAPYDCVRRAVELADRVSVNMEAPTQHSLDRLATRKHLSDQIITRMHWIRDAARKAGEAKLKSGQTTQFVVGPGGESDREILTCVVALRTSVGLRRAYFSAFSPISDTPLEGEPPAPPLRQHRLYQAEWLLREYGFTLPEIPLGADGRLSLDTDPKLAYALCNLQLFPLEVNDATQHDLLRVPGIGPTSARRILAARRRGRLMTEADLRASGLSFRRAAPFLLCGGRRLGRFSDVLRASHPPLDQLQLPLASDPARLPV